VGQQTNDARQRAGKLMAHGVICFLISRKIREIGYCAYRTIAIQSPDSRSADCIPQLRVVWNLTEVNRGDKNYID
jgi:hypothetical protein